MCQFVLCHFTASVSVSGGSCSISLDPKMRPNKVSNISRKNNALFYKLLRLGGFLLPQPRQGLTNSMGKILATTIFVNKALLKHSYAHLFPHSLWLLLGLSSYGRDCMGIGCKS